jgi:hypothetical protein
MKRIALLVGILAGAGVAGYANCPAEFTNYANEAHALGLRAADGIRSNAMPIGLAAGTFLVTVGYHKAKGKTLRESVEVAATRVTVVPVHQTVVEPETAVVKRARARATRTQLIADQIALENRHRKLPDAVAKAEKEVCYSEKALAEAERSLAEQRKAHENAVARLDSLYEERDNAQAELAAISDELNKLAVLV